MESFCHHCGFWFPTSTAQHVHFNYTSHLPMWQPEVMFIDPSVQIMLEAPWQFVMDPSPPSSPSTVETPWKNFMDSSRLSSPVAEDGPWKFTMDPPAPSSPIGASQWLPEAMLTHSPAPITIKTPWRLVMEPSPPPVPTMETFPDFPNPFMDTHPFSARVLHVPAPNMTLPVVPSIDNWARHLLNTGCSKFGRGCFGNCIPGAEELQNRSRLPLAPGLEESSKKRKATDDSDGPRKRLRTLQLRINPFKRVIKNKLHANGKIECWICNHMFFRIAAHIKTHEKECKWKCDGCQEKFPRKWVFTQHLQHGRPWCL